MAKKQKQPPQTKAARRFSRLQAARVWIAGYSGANIIRGYMKRFKVDRKCAIKELGMIGIEFDLDFEYESDDDQDSDFFYIAGYTSGGYPFGVTWEEHHDRLYENEVYYKPGNHKEEFYHIAGYTEEGEIFGVTWEEFLYSYYDLSMSPDSVDLVNNSVDEADIYFLDLSLVV